MQGLRGIACILVVLTHARYFLANTPLWSFADQVLRPGAFGVDLFFVISGFIMVYTTSRPGATPLQFISHRFTRIWPPYAVMTLIAVLIGYGGSLGALVSPGVLGPLLKSLAFIPNNPHAPLYFDVSLNLGWTLEFEAYFYMVFAVSMLFGRFRWVALFSWLIYSALIFPMARRGLDLDVTKDLGYRFGYAALMTNPIVLDFLFGVVAAGIFMSRLRIRNVRLCWNLLFMATTFVLWSCYSWYYDFHGPLKWGIPAALLVTVLALVGKTVSIPVPAALLWLGRISYSLYLTHLTTQQVMTSYASAHGIEVHSWGFIFITTCTAIFIAYFFYELVEVRLCNAIRALVSKASSETGERDKLKTAS